jgi:hypothetical protein
MRNSEKRAWLTCFRVNWMNKSDQLWDSRYKGTSTERKNRMSVLILTFSDQLWGRSKATKGQDQITQSILYLRRSSKYIDWTIVISAQTAIIKGSTGRESPTGELEKYKGALSGELGNDVEAQKDENN